MAEELFRKKSMDRVASPEQLNDYIRVSNPGVWMLLGGIIVLLAGVCIWGIFGHLDTKYTTGAACINGTLICYVDAEQVEQISKGMTILAEGKEYTVEDISANTVSAGELDQLDPSIRQMGGFSENQWFYGVSCTCDLPDGAYSVDIILESVAPMSFITN